MTNVCPKDFITAEVDIGVAHRNFMFVWEVLCPKQIEGSNLSVCLLPIFTNLINSSLLSGFYPSGLKLSYIRLVLKKHNLDKENTNNYRPITNIPFLSKRKIIYTAESLS